MFPKAALAHTQLTCKMFLSKLKNNTELFNTWIYSDVIQISMKLMQQMAYSSLLLSHYHTCY